MKEGKGRLDGGRFRFRKELVEKGMEEDGVKNDKKRGKWVKGVNEREEKNG